MQFYRLHKAACAALDAASESAVMVQSADATSKGWIRPGHRIASQFQSRKIIPRLEESARELMKGVVFSGDLKLN